MRQKRFRDYIRPDSVTWWAGVVMILSGSFELTGVSIPVASDIVRPIFKAAPEASDPAMRIMFGFGLIGMYRKLDALFALLGPRR